MLLVAGTVLQCQAAERIVQGWFTVAVFTEKRRRDWAGGQADAVVSPPPPAGGPDHTPLFGSGGGPGPREPKKNWVYDENLVPVLTNFSKKCAQKRDFGLFQGPAIFFRGEGGPDHQAPMI